MRLKDYNERDGKRVWLSRNELQLFLDNVDERNEPHIASALMARSGLRRKETVDVTFNDLRTNDQVGPICRVWEGKGDKYREVPVADTLLTMADTLQRADGRDPDDTVVQVDGSTLYNWVQKAANRCRAETSDEGWKFLGPHDLRRSWGVRLLEDGVLPSVVMEWGGWEDWQTFRNHYLAEFSPEALRRERNKVAWLGGQPTEDSDSGYSVVTPATGKSSW